MASGGHSERRKEPKLVLVLGPTGCGKTTFINLVSGAKLRVGHGLESCTSEVHLAKFELASEPVTILDTPGFDDTERPQADVLKQIATFLQKIYEDGKKLAGVIYMHRISDRRMGGVAMENYRLFRKICGDEAMANVAIVTNMWEEVTQTKGDERERELKTNFFKEAFDRGAKLRRHDNTFASASKILHELLSNIPEVLHVQDEMVEQHKAIPDTEAGTELRSILDQLEEKLNDDVGKKSAEEAHEVVDQILQKLEKVKLEQRKLREGVSQEESMKMARLSRNATGPIADSAGAPQLINPEPSHNPPDNATPEMSHPQFQNFAPVDDSCGSDDIHLEPTIPMNLNGLAPENDHSPKESKQSPVEEKAAANNSQFGDATPVPEQSIADKYGNGSATHHVPDEGSRPPLAHNNHGRAYNVGDASPHTFPPPPITDEPAPSCCGKCCIQ